MPPNRADLFDAWAADYERTVRASGEYPFGGYDDVLDTIVKLADPCDGMTVLDLGTGTGALAERFIGAGCRVWAIDFSSEMIDRAQARLPVLLVHKVDLLGPWPDDLGRRFDRIVSSYVLHEFDLPSRMELLERLCRTHLRDGGRFVIGDVAFATVSARDAAHEEFREIWDDTEHYWAADETERAAAGHGLRVVFHPVSKCGGVFVVMGTF